MTTNDHKRVTPEGRAAGEQLVRMTEPAIAALVAQCEPDERCKTCAFRLGTVPNGCMQTQLDAIKCLIEGVQFSCHQAGREGWPCHGYYAASVALREATERTGLALPAKCPWEFSPPDPVDEESAP